MSESPSTKSAAQLRAEKRNAKIKSSAGTRIASITTSARGAESKEIYGDKTTPFDRPTSTRNTMNDPADVDLSSLAPLNPQTNPFAASSIPELGDSPPDLMSLLASLSGNNGTGGQATGAGSTAFTPPPGMEDNPLFSMLQGLSGGMGGAAGQMPGMIPQDVGPREKTLMERVLPLLHVVSMVGLVCWAVVVGEGVNWARLPMKSESTKEWVGQSLGLFGGVPLVYAFITVQMVLQSIQFFITKSAPPPAGMLQSLIPMIPHPFNLYITTAIKYYALLGSILDDISILIVGLGCRILWDHYMK